MKKYYNLMEEKAPRCKDKSAHDWISIKKPKGNNSGWYEDKCMRCDVVIAYDTSD